MHNKVRILREEWGFTQKELGEKVGFSRQAINAIETGKFDPSLWLAYGMYIRRPVKDVLRDIIL